MSHFCTKRQKEWSKMVMLEGEAMGKPWRLHPSLFVLIYSAQWLFYFLTKVWSRQGFICCYKIRTSPWSTSRFADVLSVMWHEASDVSVSASRLDSVASAVTSGGHKLTAVADLLANGQSSHAGRRHPEVDALSLWIINIYMDYVACRPLGVWTHVTQTRDVTDEATWYLQAIPWNLFFLFGHFTHYSRYIWCSVRQILCDTFYCVLHYCVQYNLSNCSVSSINTFLDFRPLQ